VKLSGWVGTFLDELDEPQRLVFCLSDIEGLTAPEIAAALDANLEHGLRTPASGTQALRGAARQTRSGWARSEMKEPSSNARLILERYRAAESLNGDARARLADVVRERALRGDLPRFDVQAMPPAVPRTGLTQQIWTSAAGKVGLVLAALGAGTGCDLPAQHAGGLAAEMPSVVPAYAVRTPGPAMEPTRPFEPPPGSKGRSRLTAGVLAARACRAVRLHRQRRAAANQPLTRK